MAEPRLGGREVVRIFVKANEDATDGLLSIKEGGRKLDNGLADLVRAKYGPRLRLEILHESSGPAAEVRGEIEAGFSRLLEEAPDVVVLSIQPDLVGGPVHADSGRLNVEAIQRDLLEIVRRLKESGSRVIFFNGSTVDPLDLTSNYHGITGDTVPLRVHKLDLLVLELSVLEGISVIDVDRLVAEMGALKHVTATMDYSPDACEAICQELLRVLEDYGFFEERPLLTQIGQTADRR
jgi:hypothetical protein